MQPIKPKWSASGLVLVCERCAKERIPEEDPDKAAEIGDFHLRNWLKERLKADGHWGRIRAINTSCMDVCARRMVTVVIDPQVEGRQSEAFVVDPITDRDELYERIVDRLGGIEVETSIGLRGMDVAFYTVKDMKRARAFYDGLLGLRPGMESEHWVEYELPDGATFALAHDPTGGWKEGHGLMFGVSDMTRAAESAKALGGAITDRSFQSPGCMAAECIDPEGNYLYLHQRKL